LAHVSGLLAWVLPYPPGYDFPLPFGRRHSLLGPSCTRWASPDLAVSYTGVLDLSPDPSGLSCPARVRYDWGGCLLCSGDRCPRQIQGKDLPSGV